MEHIKRWISIWQGILGVASQFIVVQSPYGRYEYQGKDECWFAYTKDISLQWY